MKLFKDRTVGFYIGLAGAVLALVSDLVWLIIDHADRTFDLLAFILILVGALSFALVVFTKFEFAPIIPAVLLIAGLALALNVILPSVSDLWNGVNFIGGNGVLGAIFAGIFLVCTILETVCCFMKERK